MDTLTAIEQRRSVKQYDTSFVMPEEDIQKLLDLALLAPTSYNIQNWRFVVVRDTEVRQQIRAAAWEQAQVTEAQLLLVLCADTKAWAKQPERYWKDAPPETQKMLVPMIGQFYENGGEQVQRDEAMRSCGFAAQNLMLAAKAMDYDSNPMIGFDSEAIGKIIALPEDHVISMMLVIGKAAQPAHGRGGQLPKEEIVFTDHFPV